MSHLRIAQVSADRGIAPGGTKGASVHLRGIAAGFTSIGHEVTTYSARTAEGAFPVEVASLDDLVNAPVDVIYERYSLGHLGGLREARRRGVPFVLEVNAPLVDEALQHRPGRVDTAARGVEQLLLEQADVVIAVSTPLAKWISERRSGPIAVVPNGFEPEWFSGETVRRADTLVFSGHPKPWHGAESLVPLLRALTTRGHDVRLQVIGGGPGTELLRKQADDHGLADRLEITGPVPPAEAARLTRSATIGLAPYPVTKDFYFSPLKVIDYLAAGIPIVATDVGDIARLVGDAGTVVPVGDPARFADAVEAIVNDPARATSMGLRGRARAFRSMTWAEAARASIAAVAALNGGSSGGRGAPRAVA